MNTLPPVTLIVLNWNGRPFLEACLSALLGQDYPHFAVWLVDNASTDDSAGFVRQRFPQVRLIANKRNLGFAAGNNVALSQLETELAVLLNPDVVASPDWLKQLVTAVLADDRIGIAGCKLYYPGGRLQHAGGYMTYPQAIPGHYGLHEEDEGQQDTLRDVDYIIGAAMAVRREALQRVGLFDEGYFLYFEDADLCQRVAQAGYRVVYAPGATAVHHESVTTVKGSTFYLRHFNAGRWRFLLKHYDLGDILRDTLPAEEAWLSRCGPGEREALVDAYRVTLWNLPGIWAARAQTGRGEDAASQQRQIALALQRLRLLAGQSPTAGSKLAQLEAGWQVQERPFVSKIPLAGRLIARFREGWNNISTRAHVRPLLRQQNEFNRQVAHQFTDLDGRLADQDDDLINQAKDQMELVWQLAEMSNQLDDMGLLLLSLEQRLARLEGRQTKEE